MPPKMMSHGRLTSDSTVGVRAKYAKMDPLLKSTIKKQKSLKSDNSNSSIPKTRSSHLSSAANFHTWFLNLIKERLNRVQAQFSFTAH